MAILQDTFSFRDRMLANNLFHFNSFTLKGVASRFSADTRKVSPKKMNCKCNTRFRKPYLSIENFKFTF